MKVCFVGAGPGDPELITVKGQKLLARADLIIYAGSLVNPELLNNARPQARCFNSAGMTLEEMLDLMAEAVARGELVVRLHTGDPSLYGAVQEQMDGLAQRGVPFEVVPGVSSFAAAAAAVRREFTLPGVSQTLILTRHEGRTPVPPEEGLAALAGHHASLCLFLSAGSLAAAAAELARGYGPDTPAALVYKASWPEEKVIRGTLADIARRAAAAGINRTALLLTGDFLSAPYRRSSLYDPEFEHSFRGKKDECGNCNPD
ncbi:precorrin-4 C(11)-methyltransferase [Pelotomaculum terephthalicicum JT]|uniref:precorrin-4 C(11)-methyltransferase n=1 Tax=Pelotomaculum TaxID=191373 RepID=UPI0009CA8F3D|nr:MULTISPECIES: precorrin-4 C(11)-methyltransferase [Pelotomaculum]MCG9967327.1 precorrin-4 C(11)-methyltransferase [Pelotomaculum terephthalicicum JT]OPX90679.1 MAG: Cobalt-precorrin-4 C(11)-methyltransferase [Pelotomaculum sp. PtaB.Bin117]